MEKSNLPEVSSASQSEHSEIDGRKKANHPWSLSSKDVAYVSIDSGLEEWDSAPGSGASSIWKRFSVFEAPEALELYKPTAGFEGSHRFDPSAIWTPAEEAILVRKVRCSQDGR